MTTPENRFGAGMGTQPLADRTVMKGAIMILLIIGALLSCQALGAADVSARVVVTTNYYAVSGANSKEILSSMRRARPWGTNSSFHATTNWKMDWRYRSAAEGGKVRIQRCDLTTRVVMTLPQWEPPPEASPELVGRWQRYHRALSLHEDGHVRLAREATREVERRLRLLGAYDSQQELEQELKAVTNQVLEDARKKERGYDRATGHGATQGAAFW